MQLKERFGQLHEVLGVHNDVVSGRWQELYGNYQASSRAYHNLDHINALFGYFDVYQQQLKHPAAVAYAIFYHDIIYSVWSKTNEADSAKLAAAYLSQTADKAMVQRVTDLIMVTKDHQPKTAGDQAWMVDLDLEILGQSWEEYLAYTKKIRKEYRIVPSLMYKRGRKRVLEHFLKKKSIYKTAVFYELYEKQAKENLTKELENL